MNRSKQPKPKQATEAEAEELLAGAIEPYFLPKQQLVVNWWFNHSDNVVEELYGGAAGGGKSWVGCQLLIMSCFIYEGSRWLMGRAKLKTLKRTTLVTFFKVCSEWGLKRNVHFKFNENDHIIRFKNGSEILLQDLFTYPSDPNYDGLGSLEITGAFIDEVPQVAQRAVEIVSSRCRHDLKKWCECGQLNEKNEVLEKDPQGDAIKWKCKRCGIITEGLKPRLLMSCNPSRGWIFSAWYDKHRRGILEAHRRFIPAFVTDNHKLPKSYIDNLNRMNKLDRERLKNGNWEYSDFTSLFEYDQIQSFLVSSEKKRFERCFISCDVARKGKDSAVIMVMNEDKVIIEILEFKGAIKTTDLAKQIKKLQKKYEVDEYDIAIDSDGVGGGVADHFENCYEVINNGRPIDGENYVNLKTQLYYQLATEINSGELKLAKGVISDDQSLRIAEELEVIKREKIDQDSKLAITSKQQIKAMLNRSPDLSDALAYLMVFLLEDTLGDSYETL